MRRLLIAACALSLLTPLAHAGCPVPPGPPPLETQPAPVVEPNWQARVAVLDDVLARTDLSRIRTVFLGDSITEAWPQPVFDHFYAHRAALNLGVRGDFTQGLLWRVNRLPLGTKLNPQLFVILIGTNNLWPGVSVANVVAGVGAVIDTLRRRVPGAQILLLDVLPRAEQPTDPSRHLVAQFNRALSACAEPGVTIINPGPILLDGYGVFGKDISFDGLHLTWLGYAMLGAALEPAMKAELHD